jgi:xanthine/uracil/vitamin C permease (AzgA family)
MIVPNPDTIVGLGDVATDFVLQLTMFGLVLVASLLYWDIKGGILVGIAIVSVLHWTISHEWPAHIAEWPVFHNHQYIQPNVMWENPDKVPILWTAVGAFLLICVFDISGVIFGLATLAGLITEGDGHGAYYQDLERDGRQCLHSMLPLLQNRPIHLSPPTNLFMKIPLI